MPIQRTCTDSNTEKPHEPTSALPSQHGFKLASLNINKLTTYIEELRILLAHNEIDISSINETKLNETVCLPLSPFLSFFNTLFLTHNCKNVVTAIYHLLYVICIYLHVFYFSLTPLYN